jgi:hypothetical protein
VPISLPTELEATRDLQELKSFAAPMKGNDGSSLGDLGIVMGLQKSAQKLTGTGKAENRFGWPLLASTLYLHLLSCGQPNDPLEDESN